MARMPGAIWKPLPGSSTTKMSAYDIFCAHTMVGSLAGTDNYFRSLATGTNSHFGVGGDGTVYQWVDTAYRSGANLNGNYHIISAETADMGAPFGPWAGSDVPAWTQAQIDALGRIAKWASDTHGIPLAQIPDAKPGRRGVGYHRLGVPGYMVAGAEQWSTSKGKVCPGDRRIGQVPAVIAAAKGSPPPSSPSVQEDDMRLARTPDGTIWLITARDVFAIGDPALMNSLIAVWGAPVAISQDDLNRIFADADARAKRQLVSEQNYILGANPTQKPYLYDRVAGMGSKVDDLATAVSKVQAPAVDEAKLAAALLSNADAVAKLGDAIAAGLATRVHNG